MRGQLARAGSWVTREAAHVEACAEVLLRRTVDLARRAFPRGPGPSRALPDAVEPAPATAPEQVGSAAETEEPRLEPDTLPLLPWSPAHPVGEAPAGVVPALAALERIIREHVEHGGRGLRGDQRFWGVVALLQTLTTSDSSHPAPERKGQT